MYNISYQPFLLLYIRDTRYELVRMAKCYNDALRTYSQKLVELGIPAQEITSMGFSKIPTNASTGPAGLVVDSH
jgi:hypothetical protein